MIDEPGRRETFEALYERHPDPWNFDSSSYERRKREKTIAALEGRHFGKALEIGCSTGVLTQQLAARCDRLCALDVAGNAIAIARERLSARDNVELRHAEVPGDWPQGQFDLIVLSEVLYFLASEEIAAVSRPARQSLSPGGWCLLVNWTGPSDLPVSGAQAVDIFARSANWECDLHHVDERYRIDRFALKKAPE